LTQLYKQNHPPSMTQFTLQKQHQVAEAWSPQFPEVPRNKADNAVWHELK